VTSPTAARRLPEGRYDGPSRLVGRVFAVVLGALFVGLLLAIGFLLFDRLTEERVQARVIGFQVLSDDTVRIDLEVLKPEGATAYCIVRSRGLDGAEVGRAVVVVDAEGTADRTVRIAHDLRTTARPNTGEQAGCSVAPIPSRSPAP
jgi:hypothetical protein